ncbi:accessory gene regulator ArgB-like protein [Lysinibacillus sp. ACHW1.5]|uniref:accessory gene regulator ArgB-like protein n=1 Tax=Lysinibacillus sp. ACHW1.5 TaxID=2913506 RepID=UPI001EDAEDF6|nr:accessory gene regulator B family protein [Lysinibacillus sp. ACHW1.5]UKJ46026.1 accessory gene regulator B family protein [Lysinibacillus sp. ACHW1.5]
MNYLLFIKGAACIFSSLEKRITNILIQESHFEVEREKILFGVRMILNDFWKFIIVYIIAMLLDCFLATLVAHLVFYFLRQVCFGFHFQNNLVCLIASITTLPISVYIIKNMNYFQEYMTIVSAISSLILAIFAPAETKKRPVYNQRHKTFLRKKLLIRLLIIWAIIFVLYNNVITNFISFGVTLIAVFVLFQKLAGGKLK